MAATAKTHTGGNGRIGPNQFTAVAAPTVLNDVANNIRVGDSWLDTTADKAYICLDATAGAAVWQELAAVNPRIDVLVKAVAPTANDDSGDGYIVGDTWIDTVTHRVYQLVDNTLGAAVWAELTVPHFTTTTHVVAPAVTDDGADGFVVGDVWIDTATDKAYMIFDVTGGAAVWKEIT